SVGVHCAPKRLNVADCSLMWILTGMKCPLMNSLTSAFGYTSASSRAQAPHIGAALKSSSNGIAFARAWVIAASTSRPHCMSGIALSSPSMCGQGADPATRRSGDRAPMGMIRGGCRTDSRIPAGAGMDLGLEVFMGLYGSSALGKRGNGRESAGVNEGIGSQVPRPVRGDPGRRAHRILLRRPCGGWRSSRSAAFELNPCTDSRTLFFDRRDDGDGDHRWERPRGAH